MPQEKSAGAIIFTIKDNIPYYLLLHYPSGHWEFARGHGEPGESEEVTARREIAEETDIKDLSIIPGFKEYSKFSFRKTYGLTGEAKKRAPWVFKIVTLFLAQTFTENVKISKEHKGFAWLPYEEAHKKLIKNAKEILKKANDFLISTKRI